MLLSGKYIFSTTGHASKSLSSTPEYLNLINSTLNLFKMLSEGILVYIKSIPGLNLYVPLEKEKEFGISSYELAD